MGNRQNEQQVHHCDQGQKIGKMESDIEHLLERIKDIGNNLDKIDEKFGGVDEDHGDKLIDIKTKLIRLTDLVLTQAYRLNDIATAISEVDQDVDVLTRRLDTLELNYRQTKEEELKKLKEENKELNNRLKGIEKVYNYGKGFTVVVTVLGPVVLVLWKLKEIATVIKKFFLEL